MQKKLQPINRKPCLWWRGRKVIEDKDAKGFIGFGVNEKFLTKEKKAIK